ncbi:phosphatase PAP2 family protein [Chondromyces crocatus]|uniref:phosphatase PAP2 family protein n=1 Tax=Chondromyces crocatus TaxID=52 RepID=UPI00067B3A79|nr:phosphatase PAP2 family protein [Chondromyces crocatus]
MAFTVGLTASATASANPPGAAAPDWAFRSAPAEAVLAGVSAASMAMYFIPQQRIGWAPYAARPHHPTLARISDFTGALGGAFLLGGGMTLFEGAYLAQHGVPNPYARALRTTLIDAEAVMLATGIVATVKRLTGRCRPRAWHDGRCRGDDEEFTAFPSGHTTPVAAIAGVHLSLLARTPGNGALRLGALGLAEASTLVTMALRIGAGAHSWEDVGAGFLLGHVVGVAVGYAHPMVDLGPGRGAQGSAASAMAVGAGSPLSSPLFSWAGTF